MRILLMTEYLPPQMHGIATRVHHHIAHLRQLEHIVHVTGPETGPLATIPLAVTPLHAVDTYVKMCTLSASNVSHIMRITPTIDSGMVQAQGVYKKRKPCPECALSEPSKEPSCI